MKNAKNILFCGLLGTKNSAACKTAPAIPLPHSPLSPQICRNFAVFSLRKAPGKVSDRLLFWLSYALSHTFFPKKYLTNTPARPFHTGRAAKYFLVT